MATPANQELELGKRIQNFLAGAKSRTLDLSNLGLTAIPELEEIFPHSASPPATLDLLDISHNRIRHLPRWITRFSALRALNASNNRISSLPDSIGAVRALEHLDLRNNRLWQLPESMKRLTGLKQLYLHNNYLDIPPEVLGNQPSLVEEDVIKFMSKEGEELDFSDTLNMQYARLKRLLIDKTISGGDTETVRHILARFVGEMIRRTPPRDPEELLSYYFRVRAGRRPLNEAKLILVGFGAVGTTSLVNRLVHDSFDKGEAKTEGIRIIQWPIRLSANENIRLHLWDFGGQEIMHATHQFFSYY